jgi:hypothetical protein
MRQILLALVVLLSGTGSYAQLAHWQALPFRINNPDCRFFVDTSAKAMYLAGSFDTVSGTRADIICWDGQNYTLLPKSPHHHITCVRGHTDWVYASGDAGLWRLTGSTWDLVDSAKGIQNIIVWHDSLMVTGDFRSIGGQNIAFIAKWDGAVWHDFYRVDTAIFDTSRLGVLDVKEYKGLIFASGTFVIRSIWGPSYSSALMYFDGQKWLAAQCPLVNFHTKKVLGEMHIWNGDLIVTGSFDKGGGHSFQPDENIVAWNGSSWYTFANGVGGIWGDEWISSCSGFGNSLYVAGYINKASGVKLKSKGIAHWDGTRWCSLGDSFGIAEYANQVAALNGDLYVSGNFSSINADTSFHYLAKWVGGNYSDSCSVPLSVAGTPGDEEISVYPNPAASTIFVRTSKPLQIERIRMLDCMGRVLRQNDSYDERKGISIDALARGVYIIAIYSRTNELLYKSTFLKQ